MTRPRIFSSNPKLGAALAMGARLTVSGNIKHEHVVHGPQLGGLNKTMLLGIGGMFRAWRLGAGKIAPPILVFPVHARSLDGAIAEICNMVDGQLTASLSINHDTMVKLGYSDAQGGHEHTGAIGRTRLVEICRQSAHLMMEWGKDELLRATANSIFGWGPSWWVKPEDAERASGELLESGTITAPTTIISFPPPELIHTPQACFVKWELPKGSLLGRIKIQ